MSDPSHGPATAAGSSWRDRAAGFFGIDDDWQRPRPAVSSQDVVLAVGVAVFGLLVLEVVRSSGGLDHTAAPVWVQWCAVISGAVLLLGRRRWPLVVAGSAAAHMFLVGVTMPQVMALMALQAVYFIAILSGVAWARDRRSMALVVSSIVLFMFAWVGWQFALGSALQDWLDEDGIERVGVFSPAVALVAYSLLINGVYFGGAVIGGAVSWRAARQRASLQEQAATIAVQAGRLRDQAVTDERLRIARELHDVVAHHVSAMGIQAGAARRVLERDPGAARAALSHVEEASRDAVTQMRSLLGTLRAGEDAEVEARTADPGIGDLAALVTDQEGDGLDIRLDVVQEPCDGAGRLPHGLDLSVYRTVQEALTNVRRHSTADRVSVVVRVDEAAARPYAEVEIVDNGRPRSGSSGSGLGQLGIRERAASHRGEVDIGPRLTGGYRVRVRYPLGAGS